MNKRAIRLIEPGTRLFLFVMMLFAGATFFFHRELAICECIVIALLVIYSIVSSRKGKSELLKYIESITYDVEAAKNDTLLNFPLPMVVFKLEGNQVVWGNQMFFDICGRSSPTFGKSILDYAPDFSPKWILDGKTQCPNLVDLSSRRYQIYGNIVRSEDDEGNRNYMGITYWLDVTDYDLIRKEYENSRPVIMIIVLDNYDELQKGITERERNELRAAMEDKVTAWCEGKSGVLRRFDRDRYLFIFEERAMAGMLEDKFSILDDMHSIVNLKGIHATVSIGIGRDGGGFDENWNFASLSIEMALSRGGDQAVIKNRFNFEFFGGRGTEVETRTKVKSRVMANALSELISDASQTFIMGHKYADMDSLGAAVGICCIARKRGKKAKMVIDMQRNACESMLKKLITTDEYADVFVSAKEAMLRADNKSLLVVVDTNRPEQVEDKGLLLTCNRVAVIDHHRRAATYIENAVFSFYEPYASSVCELMTELLQELVEQQDILRYEAETMLAGIVTDTKSFSMRTGERTFDAAAFLRRAGADTEEVKKLLQNDFDHMVSKYAVLEKTKLYRDNVAIAVSDTPVDRIVASQAADELLGVSGIEASLVMYPTQESGVIISARSIGDINVQVLLEGFGGGGNRSSAGAQLANVSISDAAEMVRKAIDEYCDE